MKKKNNNNNGEVFARLVRMYGFPKLSVYPVKNKSTKLLFGVSTQILYGNGIFELTLFGRIIAEMREKIYHDFIEV